MGFPTALGFFLIPDFPIKCIVATEARGPFHWELRHYNVMIRTEGNTHNHKHKWLDLKRKEKRFTNKNANKLFILLQGLRDDVTCFGPFVLITRLCWNLLRLISKNVVNCQFFLFSAANIRSPLRGTILNTWNDWHTYVEVAALTSNRNSQKWGGGSDPCKCFVCFDIVVKYNSIQE